MAKSRIPKPATSVTAILPGNELWSYDDDTDRAFTLDIKTRNRLMKETHATISGRYSIPNGGSFIPAWQLTVKHEHRALAKHILGVTTLTT